MVECPDTYISVAHGAGCVAVAISDSRVGVDIERADRDFGSVSSRYMSEQEVQMSRDGLWAAKVWCAKEALYKLYGRRGVELREELIIESYDEDNEQLRARMVGQAAAVVDIELRGDNVIVAVAYFE